jgi:predicted DsbA family dithiol-disulfide isomerase
MALTIDVFSDVVCPWCYIGTERLEGVLAELGDQVAVTVALHPFLLDDTTPVEGVEIAAMLRQKYGADPAAMFARVEGAARESGQALELARQPRMYPTVLAHTLLRHAAAKGTQRALSRALFRANFDEGRNIADVAVLTEVAAAHGFAADEVARRLGDPAELAETRRDAAAANRGGIRGVPFFVFGGTHAVSGAQPAATLKQAIVELAKSA